MVCRTACRSEDYKYQFDHTIVATTIGYMLCTHRQRKGNHVEIRNMENYKAHKKARKLFTTFIADVIRKCGEGRVISANYDRYRTTTKLSYSSMVLEEVSRAIMADLFNGRDDLFYMAIEWGSDEERNQRMSNPKNKRIRRNNNSSQRVDESDNNEPARNVWKQHISRVPLTYQGNY